MSGVSPGESRSTYGVRKAGELLAGDVDPVAVLVEVALEGDLDLDEPRAQPLELGSVLGRQLMAGAPEVAQPELEQPRGARRSAAAASSVAAKARTASNRSLRKTTATRHLFSRSSASLPASRTAASVWTWPRKAPRP